ncbi:MAG: tetratricopeptide repeat protein [Thermoanaerobaculia bacterium]|nr:tetratricopeptide repeat protein [Thermoanaerobaculia bacterium]
MIRRKPLLVLVFGFLLAGVEAVYPTESPGKREIRQRYRGALTFWADGRQEEAVAAGLALERSSGGTPRDLARLRREQQAVVRSISRRRPQALVPVAVYQLGLLARTADEGDRLLAASGGQLVDEILATLVRRGTTRTDRSVAAHLYTAFGAVLHERKREIEAARRYQEALELEPELFEALVALGIVEEKRGRPASARRRFTAALGEGARAPEVLLRYAVTSLAIGETDEARAALHRALDSDPDPWVRIVASEELARSEEIRGDLDAAARIAASAARDHPCLTTLRALALLYSEMAESPLRMTPFPRESCRGSRPSPRARYNLPPTGLFHRLREEVASLERSRRSELARAVDR